MRGLFLLLLISGCVVEPETRACVDHGSHTFVKEECVPLYGRVICTYKKVTKLYCKRYLEEEENDSKIRDGQTIKRDI